ncbi:MAG TPA: sulfotransferase [Polyangiales bacterium]|nr:sulfotransferase [Polyangiales bacterium]
MPRLFFILGRGRSGTTWLARTLTQHPRIAVAPEGLFVLDLFDRYAPRPLSPEARTRFCADLRRERRMHGWHLQPQRVAARLHALPEPVRYAQACAAVYESYAADTLGRSGLTWIGDKNPLHALFGARLAQLFPDARFVHLSRDHRDNVRSFRSAAFDLGHPGALAYRWRRYNQEILSLAERAPGRVLSLRFEDVLQRPQHELARICAFLELEPHPAMLDARRSGPRLRPGARPGWFEQPPDALAGVREQAGAPELPAAMIDTADAIAGPIAERLGYARTSRSGSRDRRAPAPMFSTALGWLYGWSSVQAEKLLFSACPAELRMALINAYRRAPGRNP